MNTALAPDPAPQDDPVLREALKRCSPATYYAACKFKQTRRPGDLHTVVVGVIERFVERDRRALLLGQTDAVKLKEHLGLDSLTLMEIVMLAEEVFPISVSNEELTRLCTVGDVGRFISAKLNEPAPSTGSHTGIGAVEEWNVRHSAAQITPLSAASATNPGR